MAPYMSLLLWNGLFVALCVIATLFRRGHVDREWLAIALLLFNANVALVLNFFGLNEYLYAVIGSGEGQFNWAGKLFALSLSLAVLLGGRLEWQAVGITLRQSPQAYFGWAVFALLCAIDIAIALTLDNSPHSIETIAYQLTMPSLEEEIFYRGILLLCLVKALGHGPRILWSQFGWAAVISSVMFGAIHGLAWGTAGPTLAVEGLVFAGLLGLILTWLRLNTGSLIVPILLHSVINVLWRII